MNSAGNSPSTRIGTGLSPSDNTFPGEERSIGGFTYGVGVSVGILVLITTITVASYFCTRDGDGSSNDHPQHNHNRQQQQQEDDDHYVIEIEGIDEATLKAYPKCLYSQLLLQSKNEQESGGKKKGSTESCCSICLADYKGSDLLRQLPDCGHIFHLKCIDPWLRLHPTCPVCRTSPLPTPQSTPLAEIVPVATSRLSVSAG